MKKLILLSALIFCHFGIMAEEDCIIFPNTEWAKAFNYLDDESRREAILERIRCERLAPWRPHLIFVVQGLVAGFPPECRDLLLSLMDADISLLFDTCANSRIMGRCPDVLFISNLNNPIINNIDGLAVLDVERTLSRRRTRSRVSIRLQNEQSRELTFRIENFDNRNNQRSTEMFVRRGRSTVRFSVRSGTVKVITITDSENNVATILI